MPRFSSLAPLFLGVVLFVFARSAVLAGERRALIVVGLSANETQAARLHETAASIQASLVRRGLATDSVRLLRHGSATPVRRETILSALAPARDASAEDETWLVLLGTSAPDRSGQAAFQIAGPRLSASDLAAALGALPGKKFVLVGTSASGAFLPPLLPLSGVEAVAATAEAGQIDEPRFTAFWAEALAAAPAAPFAELAAAAADRVTAYYEENSLAQTETARLLDPAARRILEPPFRAATAAAPAGGPAASRPADPFDIASLSIPKASGGDEIERRPPDAGSLALLAEARAAARDLEHAALILRTEADITVAADFSSRETWRSRAYLRTGEALDVLGTLRLPQEPPFVSSSLVSARVIRPDGSQLLLDPAARSARLASEREAERSRLRPAFAAPYVELPEVTADCVIEAEWTIDRRSDGTLPEFYQEWHLARPFPQKSLQVRLSQPNGSPWKIRGPDAQTPVQINSSYFFHFADLPAHEPLPHDPPSRSTQPWLGLSSVASWDAFADWYRRLAADSDKAGPAVDALAAEIAAAHPDRASRLRAAYERVAELRYVAIELGVGAFRPRTPEQVWLQRHGDCKDKANLLVAILARLGIRAEFALVNRFDATFTDFPGWQFNHALARVPAAPEAGQPHDLWLDSTDRLVPFGVIGPGNLGRPALVFAPAFASAVFHEITATQEPPAEWRETITRPAGLADDQRRVRLTATGSAEVALRRLLLELSPAQRRHRLQELLGAPVSALTLADPYDLRRPFFVEFTAARFADDRAPLIPGLAEYLAPAERSRIWDEGREWLHIRQLPSGSESRRPIPARLP